MMFMREKDDARVDWMEIHHSNIEGKDIEHWFNRVEFLIDDRIYSDDSEEFQKALFWERLSAK